MINQTSAVAFRQNLGEMLNQAQYRHDSIAINPASPIRRACRAKYSARGEAELARIPAPTNQEPP